jgi:hypothetical protein
LWKALVQWTLIISDKSVDAILLIRDCAVPLWALPLANYVLKHFFKGEYKEHTHICRGKQGGKNGEVVAVMQVVQRWDSRH